MTAAGLNNIALHCKNLKNLKIASIGIGDKTIKAFQKAYPKILVDPDLSFEG